MLTLTITETRSNLDVKFYKAPADFISYIQKYNDVRHRTVYGWTTSPDLLSRTFVHSFNSQQDHDAFLADSTVSAAFQDQKTYNTNNNIIKTVTVT